LILKSPSSFFPLSVTFPSFICLAIFLLGFAVGLLLSGGAANDATVTLTMKAALTDVKPKMTMSALYFT